MISGKTMVSKCLLYCITFYLYYINSICTAFQLLFYIFFLDLYKFDFYCRIFKVHCIISCKSLPLCCINYAIYFTILWKGLFTLVCYQWFHWFNLILTSFWTSKCARWIWWLTKGHRYIIERNCAWIDMQPGTVLETMKCCTIKQIFTGSAPSFGDGNLM